MKKFIFKILVIILITIIIIAAKIYFTAIYGFEANCFENVPLNNISNSPCFKAKIDHLSKSQNFKNCTFLIAGSSISLNNISGNIIFNRTKESVYNISSWRLKPKQINQFINLMKLDKIKYILVAFNNWDFGKVEYQVDFKATHSYINDEKLSRFWSFISKFNINTFCKDWNYRNKNSKINNVYSSLNFDSFGSIQLEPTNFSIDNDRWDDYVDTTGFNYFYNDVNNLDSICKKHNIVLVLAYLPSRPNLLPEKNIIQNQGISKILHSRFKNSFFDMQNLALTTNQFCDGTHLFKDGAESITNSIIDSLVKNYNLTYQKDK